MRLFRLAKILAVSSRYGLDEMLLEHEPSGRLASISRVLHFWRRFDEPQAVRLRKALEALGPIFVKFGQVLSTRRDLLPPDFADELAKLQDRVPPFASALALAEIEKAYGKPAAEVFTEFSIEPVASASVLVLLIVSVAVHLALIGLGLLFFGAEGSRTPAFTDISFFTCSSFSANANTESESLTMYEQSSGRLEG